MDYGGIIMNEQEVFEKVAGVIAGITEDEGEIRPDSRLMEDIGLVSIGFVELVVELEETFDVTFPDTLLTDNNLITVKDVTDQVMKLL